MQISSMQVWECSAFKVDFRQLKYYYVEDDGGGLFISNVHPEVKSAVTKVAHFCSVSVLCSGGAEIW